MQEKGKVTFALNGERLVGSEDVVPLSSGADLLEGSCGQSKGQRSECFLDWHRASQPLDPHTQAYQCHQLGNAGTAHPRPCRHCSSRAGG